jgi:hypothetical protein
MVADHHPNGRHLSKQLPQIIQVSPEKSVSPVAFSRA